MNEPIGIETTVAGDMASVREKTVAALKAEGFGVLTEIDVRKTMKEKIGADFIPYVILGACNPKLAHAALTATLDVGLVMPCNVVLSERTPGKITVAAMNPGLMDAMIPGADLSAMAAEAKAKLTRVIASL
ncbi:MAG: DUF302 domain-containing protein [Nitrospinae bacterium]|nr:DUF302 domain-containing protein [Nitrospinota bacterium]